ncbi:hypothetical protein NMY22_g9972 [Coprinellus aureogranulatus]|nr:hypothetical protein NMY22_g9972 [Coprinellus aureogranulatus]
MIKSASLLLCALETRPDLRLSYSRRKGDEDFQDVGAPGEGRTTENATWSRRPPPPQHRPNSWSDLQEIKNASENAMPSLEGDVPHFSEVEGLVDFEPDLGCRFKRPACTLSSRADLRRGSTSEGEFDAITCDRASVAVYSFRRPKASITDPQSLSYLETAGLASPSPPSVEALKNQTRAQPFRIAPKLLLSSMSLEVQDEETENRIADLLLACPREIIASVFSWLPLWTLRIIRRSETWVDLVGEGPKFTLREFFERWRVNYSEALTFMRLHGVYIGGEVALAIVKPDNWQPSTIDFYVPYRCARPFAELLSKQGYNIACETMYLQNAHKSFYSNGAPDDPSDTGATRIQSRMDVGVNDGVAVTIVMHHYQHPHLTINVYVSVSDHAAVPILLHPSIHLMNIVTGYGILCPYPISIRRKTAMLNLQMNPPLLSPVNPVHLEWILRDQARGYTFLSDQKYIQKEPPHLSQDPRIDSTMVPCRRFCDEQGVWTGDILDMQFDRCYPIVGFTQITWETSVRLYLWGETVQDSEARVIVSSEDPVPIPEIVGTTCAFVWMDISQ